jgi:putative ABC transport system substrate-binding protein
MQRREFITLFGGTAATWPLAARAQQSSRMKRIAMVSPADKIGDIGVNGSSFYRMVFEELSRLGYVEGQNFVVERYSGEGRTEHYADLARDVVNTHPDLIFSISTRLALNFKAATTTIPIVTTTADPIAGGLVSSLAHLAEILPALVSMRDWKLWANAWRFSWRQPQNCPMLVSLYRN